MKSKFKCIAVLIFCMMAMICVVGLQQKDVSADTEFHTATFHYNKERVLKHVVDETGNIADSLKSYTVTVEHGKCATETRTIDNSIFQYYTYTWTVGGVEVDLDNYAITKDTAFFAEWTPKEYKVYYSYGGVEDEIINLQESVTFTVESPRIKLYTPERPNYAFKGWYDTPNDEGSVQAIYIYPRSIGDKIYFAKFYPIEYYINYNTDASHNNPRGYNVLDSDFSLLDPSKEGHIFKGWYLDSNYQTSINSVDCSVGGNLDLYAKWELETYDVTYILPDGTTQVVVTEYGKTAKLPKINKSIFEIVKTDVSRDNITEDVIIEIELVNICYIYVIAILLLAGITTLIIYVRKRRERVHNNLRTIYHSNAINGKRK